MKMRKMAAALGLLMLLAGITLAGCDNEPPGDGQDIQNWDVKLDGTGQDVPEDTDDPTDTTDTAQTTSPPDAQPDADPSDTAPDPDTAEPVDTGQDTTPDPDTSVPPDVAPDTTPAQGSCCIMGGGCLETTQSQCSTFQGQFTAGQTCSQAQCGGGMSQMMPCCQSGGGCQMQDSQTCLQNGGTPQPAQSCSQAQCGATQNVPCCNQGGGCDEIGAQQCIQNGGQPQLMASSCSQANCAAQQPCCVSVPGGGSQCLMTDEMRCRNQLMGTPSPAGSCQQAQCGSTSQNVPCCVQGSCSMMSRTQCRIQGTVKQGSSCGSVTCEQPEPCCLNQSFGGRTINACRMMAPSKCTGQAMGTVKSGSSCAGKTCGGSTQLHACCVFGNCFNISEQNCQIGGTLKKGQVCSQTTCP